MELSIDYVFRVIINDRAYRRWFIKQFLQPPEKLVRVRGWS